MVSDCDESASVGEPNSTASRPETRNLGNEITEIEEGLCRVLSSLLALAQEQHLSTICQSLSRLKQAAEETLLSGYGPTFCPSFPANARQALSEFRFLLDLKARTARLSLDELRAKSAEFEKYLAYSEWEFKDAQVVFKNEVARLAGVYAMRVNHFFQESTGQLGREIREQFRLLEEADRSERSERMNSFLQDRLHELLGTWQAQFEEPSMELFQHAAVRFAKHARGLIAGIRSNTSLLFGFPEQSTGRCENFAESDGIACILDRGSNCFSNDAHLCFSVARFRKHLLRNTLRSASSDLLSYASRAVEDHKSHLEKSCSDLLKQMTQQLNEAREGINNVVETSLCRLVPKGESIPAQRELGERGDAIDVLHRYEGELDLLLYRWETVEDSTEKTA